MIRMSRFAMPLLMLAAMACPALAQDHATASIAQVTAVEQAFAHSMAQRNFAAFATFVADDAVFFGDHAMQRGKPQVLGHWKAFFAGAEAPFSWAPDQVEVLASGDLALSTGPVRDARGAIVGRFNSVWRREPDGRWRVVFDKGSPYEGKNR